MKFALFVLLASFSFSTPAFALTGDEILKTVDKNLQPGTYESYRKLINIEPSGAKREFILYTLKKGTDKVVSLFLSPSSEKGRSTLRLDENMWLYIPSVARPLRITSLQSVVGGVFNNADILRLDYHAEYSVTNLNDDKKQHLLHLKAKSGSVAYDKLKMWVDKETMLPTRIECYASTGLLIKTIYFKQPKAYGGGIRRPAVVETDSPLQKGYRSIMIFVKITKKDLADEVFSLSFLPKVGTLR